MRLMVIPVIITSITPLLFFAQKYEKKAFRLSIRLFFLIPTGFYIVRRSFSHICRNGVRQAKMALDRKNSGKREQPASRPAFLHNTDEGRMEKM